MKNKILVGAVALVVVLGFALPVGAQARFGFKLGGGMSYIGGGDFNPGLEGYLDYIADMFQIAFGGDSDGEHRPFHWGASFSGELFYQVTPRFAVGLGAGYMAVSSDSSMRVSVGSESLNMFWTPSVKAVPVMLNAHYFVPLAEGLKLVLSAGAGWYFVRYDQEELVFDDQELKETKGGGFGAHGGLGLELEMTRGFSLTLDVFGRYARIGELSGPRSSDPGSDGTYWYLEADMDVYGLGDYSLLLWDEGVPGGVEIDIENLRKARLGLSGFGAAIGFLVRI
jgi:hypothetical protein